MLCLRSEPATEVSRLETFRYLAHRVCHYAFAAGTSVRPYLYSDLPLFSKLSVNRQDQIIEDLRRTCDFCVSYESEGWELKELKQMVWFALSRMGLRSPGGALMDLVEDGDIVEIHDGVGQVFRSFTYYPYTSYTKEELTSVHWADLYERDPVILEIIERSISKAMSENLIVSFTVPTHLVIEKRSARYEIMYSMKHFIPLCLRNETKPKYLLAIVRAELLSKNMASDDDASLLMNYVRSRGRA